MSEKSLAMAGLIPRARVITGKATAPPPSEVMPGKNWPKFFCQLMVIIVCTH